MWTLNNTSELKLIRLLLIFHLQHNQHRDIAAYCFAICSKKRWNQIRTNTNVRNFLVGLLALFFFTSCWSQAVNHSANITCSTAHAIIWVDQVHMRSFIILFMVVHGMAVFMNTMCAIWTVYCRIRVAQAEQNDRWFSKFWKKTTRLQYWIFWATNGVEMFWIRLSSARSTDRQVSKRTSKLFVCQN